MSGTPIWAWGAFAGLVTLLLALDLGVFHRQSHEVKTKEALIWSAVWIAIALTFNVGVYFLKGPEAGVQFLTGYLIEKSLSVDNIFVFILLFSFFKIPALYQHRVLFWGILGALIMRAVMIGAGAAALEHFHWVIYIFGGFLIYTGVRMALHDPAEDLNAEGGLVRVFRRFVPATNQLHGAHFFIRDKGRWVATPLMLALVAVEATDLVFAVDSIPAIFAVTRDPFIVYTSNIFAILGLRSLYFALQGLVERFHYLRFALAAILIFVGLKMSLADFFKVPIWLSLTIIAGCLVTAILASLASPRRPA